MKIRITVLAAFLLLAGTAAQATLKAIQEAFELSLDQVVLPANDTGQLVVHRCAGCKPETLRVAADTQYFIRPATRPVSLDDARKAAGKAAGRRQASAYVYYDPKTRTVRRLVLDLAQSTRGHAS
jgi:hypothetical protein